MDLLPLLVTAVVFYSIITIIRLFSSHLLRRKLIKAGHFEKAEILNPHVDINDREDHVNRFPALKWGLVALFGGIGLIVIDAIGSYYPNMVDHTSVMPYGVFFVSIALGFLTYFFVANAITKKK